MTHHFVAVNSCQELTCLRLNPKWRDLGIEKVDYSIFSRAWKRTETIESENWEMGRVRILGNKKEGIIEQRVAGILKTRDQFHPKPFIHDILLVIACIILKVLSYMNGEVNLYGHSFYRLGNTVTLILSYYLIIETEHLLITFFKQWCCLTSADGAA